MNWTWNVRSNDGAMNGLEFARCTTAGGFTRVFIHAAPGQASIEIIDGDDRVVARANLNRSGDYSPMTLGSMVSAASRAGMTLTSSPAAVFFTCRRHEPGFRGVP